MVFFDANVVETELCSTYFGFLAKGSFAHDLRVVDFPGVLSSTDLNSAIFSKLVLNLIHLEWLTNSQKRSVFRNCHANHRLV